MEVIFSEQDNAYNFIHDNGVQTSIKLTPSGQYTETMDRESPEFCDKNKFTVIISVSKGCQMSCDFCHLTKIDKKHEELSGLDIASNVAEALLYLSDQVNLSEKYIKLCYMGEGEPLHNVNKIIESAEMVLDGLLKDGMVAGVDGVDIATSMPRVSNNKLKFIDTINEILTQKNYPLNPANHTEDGRTLVRLFYSMHHYDEVSRETLMPRTRSNLTATAILSELDLNIVTHYMFMKGVNDSEKDVLGLVDYVNSNQFFSDKEFRILRYNSFDSLDMESDRMENIIKYLKKSLNVGKLKIQYSAGEDVKAACGMFI